MITFYSEGVDNPIQGEKDYVSWIEKAIMEENYNCGDIAVIFCSDEYLLNINQEYLNHNYYTDIITFDYSNESIKSGDLFISLDRVSDNAKQFGVSFDKELARVIIHGVLHLMGYKDSNEDEKNNMRGLENKYLKLLSRVEEL